MMYLETHSFYQLQAALGLAGTQEIAPRRFRTRYFLLLSFST